MLFCEESKKKQATRKDRKRCVSCEKGFFRVVFASSLEGVSRTRHVPGWRIGAIDGAR